MKLKNCFGISRACQVRGPGKHVTFLNATQGCNHYLIDKALGNT